MIELNKDTFEKEINETSGTVLVKFSAPWCGPCKILSPIVDQVAEELKDQIKVFSVDVDNSPSITKQFGIRAVPTLVVFKDGQLITKQSGVMSKEKIIEMVNK